MNKVTVKVVPGAKRNLVQKEEEGLKVYLTAPAVDGKANKALIAALAGHFKIKKRQIMIQSGLKSRKKIIVISE
ncbi:MAG: DUF167 domain-containing protein [Candidatus Omnitrophica bacterium]|nr:DUF167 domain-containing protein [Candidatus Omnitrophota bacterium]